MASRQSERDRQDQQNGEREQRPGALEGNTPPVRKEEGLG